MVKILAIIASVFVGLFGFYQVADHSEPIFGARTGADIQIAGTGVNSGTSGSVLFIDSNIRVNQDNANFYWDDTANRFGIVYGGTLNTAFEVGGVASVGTNLNVGENSTATTSATFETRSTTQGSCFILVDSAGTVKYARVNAASAWVINTTSCQ